MVTVKLNLWRGWGVKVGVGDWSLMKEHIKVVLAGGNEKAFDYIIRWLAWAVQHPDQRAEVALVFKGGRGVGKGTLGNAMCRIFGQHGVHISNASHLTGFNGQAQILDGDLVLVGLGHSREFDNWHGFSRRAFCDLIPGRPGTGLREV